MTWPGEARERAYRDWRDNVILGTGVADVSHEAFCAGWEALYAKLGNDHHVVFTADRWTVEHSVECALSGHMPECEYHAAIARAAEEIEPADVIGRWRIDGVDSEGLPSLTGEE